MLFSIDGTNENTEVVILGKRARTQLKLSLATGSPNPLLATPPLTSRPTPPTSARMPLTPAVGSPVPLAALRSLTVSAPPPTPISPFMGALSKGIMAFDLQEALTRKLEGMLLQPSVESPKMVKQVRLTIQT